MVEGVSGGAGESVVEWGSVIRDPVYVMCVMQDTKRKVTVYVQLLDLFYKIYCKSNIVIVIVIYIQWYQFNSVLLYQQIPRVTNYF